MKKIYTSLADSIHYNPNASYLNFKEDSKKRRNNPIYLNEVMVKGLESRLNAVLNSHDTILAFTLNQLSDNPVWFQNFNYNTKLFELLCKLFINKKAFISTYKNHTISSYALNCMISAWVKICDGNDDLRYISSLVEALKGICGKPKPDNDMIIEYNDDQKEAMHEALFGISKLVEISNNQVKWGKNHCVSIDDYLDTMWRQRDDHQGFYTCLPLIRDQAFDTENISDPILKLYLERMKKLDSFEYQDIYKDNDSFVNDNHMSLSTVMQDIVQSDMFGHIFESVLDTTLEKRIRRQKDAFMRKAQETLIDISHQGNNRSKMYESIEQMIHNKIKPIMNYADNNYVKNDIRTYIFPLFYQSVDFCYTYFNMLQVYGVSNDVSFDFTFYKTHAGKPIESSVEFFDNSFYENKVCYYVFDEHTKKIIGSFINFEYAREKIENEWKDHKNKCYITDRNKSIIMRMDSIDLN